MNKKHGALLSLAICLLLCFTVVGGVASAQTSAGGLQCNTFPPTDHYGIQTNSCGEAAELARELLVEGGSLGVLGNLREDNGTVMGRYTMFTPNDENASIRSYGVWSAGSIYQVFDGIDFTDAAMMSGSIEGPVYNATVNGMNVRIHNHPGGIIEIEAERSSSVKLTMAGGVNAERLTAEQAGSGSVEAARLSGNNISAMVMVKGGSLDMAGDRSLIINLAKGGELLFRAASDPTPEQAALLDALPSGNIAAEYWALTRDDGAIYDLTAYDDISFDSSQLALKMGDWEIRLPDQAAGGVVGLHTDRLSMTISGGIDSLLSQIGGEAMAVNSLEEVINAAKEGAGEALYFMEQTNNRVDVYLYIPGEGGDGGSDTSGSGQQGNPLGGSDLLIPAVLGIAVVGIIGAVLWLRRPKKK